jgi:small ligand-binding sensory domain FIST
LPRWPTAPTAALPFKGLIQAAVALHRFGNGNIRGHGAVGGVFSGGLSGVVFGESGRLVSRVTQGCQPVSPEREITEADGNLLLKLDGEPALDVLLDDLQVSLDAPEQAVEAVRATLVGLSEAGSDGFRRTRDLGADVRVRHIIGLDPTRRGVAVPTLPAGMRMSFCRRNARAAPIGSHARVRRNPRRLEPESRPDRRSGGGRWRPSSAAPGRRIAGAVYVSCSGRGGPHFGAPGAELQIVRHALGDVPLVGFFAAGEIARNHLYGYTGVLTVFTSND